MPGIRGIGPKGPHRRPVLATRAPQAQARGQARKGPNSSKNRRGRLHRDNSGPIRFPSPLLPPKCTGSEVSGEERCRPPDAPCSNGQCTEAAVWLFFIITIISNGSGMKGDQDRAGRKTAPDVKDSRRDRLKLALRENLKRRKSQARGRSETSASSESADASLDTASGEKP
jgi:hypothetical protein